MDLFFSIIDAIGSIATAVAVVVALAPFRTKMKVDGGFPLKQTDVFVISVANTRNRDNEIKAITFFKGSPKKSDSHPFYNVDLSKYEAQVNPKTNNILIPREGCVDIEISCKCIVCNYEKLGEAVGRHLDTIFVVLRDIKGNKYYINTHANADFYRKLITEE